MLVRIMMNGKPSGITFMIIGIAMCIIVIWSLLYKLNMRFDVINTEQQYVHQILPIDRTTSASLIVSYFTTQSDIVPNDDKDRIVSFIVTASEGLSTVEESTMSSAGISRKNLAMDTTGILYYAQGSVIVLRIPIDSILNESMRISILYPDVGEVVYRDIRSKLREIRSPKKAPPTTAGIDNEILGVHTMSDQLRSCSPASYLANTDFRGFDLPVVPVVVQSANDCCILCSQTADCKAWTLTEDSTCWLKSSQAALPNSRIEMIGLTSGILIIDGAKPQHLIKTIRKNLIDPDILPCCQSEMNSGSSSIPSDLDSSLTLGATSLKAGSPWNLRVIHGTSVWTQQWPIGNGKIGALIGGAIDAEVVPLSIAGLFVRKNRQNNANGDLNNEVENTKHEAFLEARKAMNRGAPSEATQLMKALQHNKLGMFQYLSDLNMIFSPTSFVLEKRPPNERKIRKRKDKAASSMGRQKLTDRFQLEFQGKKLAHQSGNSGDENSSSFKKGSLPVNRNSQPVLIEVVEFEKFGDILFSNGLLDMRRGIARTFIVEEVKKPSTPTNEGSSTAEMMISPINIHSREWFASEIDDVIVGRLACYNAGAQDMNRTSYAIPGQAKEASACLNVALELVRQINEDFGMPYQTIEVSEVKESSLIYHEREYRAKNLSVSLYQIEFVLKANENVELPHAHLCGIALCGTPSISKNPVSAGNSAHNTFGTSYSTKGFVCNQASLMDIFLAIEISDDQNDGNIRSSCFQRVRSAVKKGYSTLRQRHSEFFSKRMNRVQLTLASPNETQSCPYSSLTSRLKHFGQGCQNISTVNSPVRILEQLYGPETTTITAPTQLDTAESVTIETVDVHLVAQMFQFGRYLLMSCGSRSLCNLQGLWADGPTSAWSGDYHLNINVQETYWAANAGGMQETVQPLLQFVRDLSIKGQITAKDLYNCSNGGWVAHGFTDNQLNTGILGDSEWALCVTCGAWLANQAFDYITYSADPTALIDVVIPALRGVATFFLEYMAVGDSMRSTGPTTSPENSYRMFTLRRKSSPAVNITAPKGPPLPPQLPFPLKRIQQREPLTSNYFDIITESVEHIAMSPAIDLSILRQAASAFSIATTWASKESSSQAVVYHKSNLNSDRLLAEAFRDAVMSMHGGALPHIGHHGRIVEYPQSIAAAVVGYDIADILNLNPDEDALLYNLSTPVGVAGVQRDIKVIDESLDLGHRHFSSMHWLFPNNFHSGDNALLDKLISAGRKTMELKRANNGGHTSWSSAWKACLWARLYDGDVAMEALTRILREYSAANLLSLHPPLTHSGPPDCPTCFTHPTMQDKTGASIQTNAARGMTSVDEYKFQIDGNVGFVAAICELLLQTHVPQHILIMPALPAALADAGEVRGLRGRGGFQADITWSRGRVNMLVLRFSKDLHPWFAGESIREHHVGSGFYHASSSQHKFGSRYEASDNASSAIYSIKLAAPNILKIVDASHLSGVDSDLCFRWNTADSSGSHLNNAPKSHWTRNLSLRRLEIMKLPCVIYLCGVHNRDSVCAKMREQNSQQLT